MLEEFKKRVRELEELENPRLSDIEVNSCDSEDLECPECGLPFSNGNDIRKHWQDNHPEITKILKPDIKAKSKYVAFRPYKL